MKKQMSTRAKIILSIVSGIVFTSLYYYFTLPAINPMYPGFWFTLALVIASFAYPFLLKPRTKARKSSGAFGKNVIFKANSDKTVNLGVIIAIAAPIAIMAGKEDPIGMERMMRSVMPALGFSMAWRIEAMFQKGFIHEAIRDISSAWGKMVDADSRTGWERLDVPEMNATHYYDATGSFCHGWMASPAFQLPQWIVGIKPEADGFRKISIAPNLDTLTFAEASVPTANGEIVARIEKAGKGYTLYLDLPKDVENCEIIWSPDRTETVLGGGKYMLSYEG